MLWRAFGRPWWNAVTRFVIAHDVDEGWLIIAFAAVIGAGAGYAIGAFYLLMDIVRGGGGQLGVVLGFGAGSRWLPFLIVPLGLLAARWVRLSLAPAPRGRWSLTSSIPSSVGWASATSTPSRSSKLPSPTGSWA